MGRKGGALTEVWTTGTPCRWICPCLDCDQPAPTAPDTAPAERRAGRGDLRPGDTVWLRPKTLGCPTICWKQPRATVIGVDHTYLIVKVGRREHRIHADNIRRTDPTATKSVITVRPKARPAPPDGYTEQTLF
ncbi:hypothetical protein [Krasilnikovia sp. MM14-A1004]|uniref:hypothetical protein n=1 Tax=Krasilnikovia sp. MM14-A1004 TaxID=3373541 RepID=UPI00399CB840